MCQFELVLCWTNIMLICALFHENNNVLSRLDLLFQSEFGINSNFIHIIEDLAGYYSKGQKCHLAHYCFNPSYNMLILSLRTASVSIHLCYCMVYGELLLVTTKHLYNICTMLDQRRRRWSNFAQMLYKCFVFTGILVITLIEAN